jgi:hypothetical protein
LPTVGSDPIPALVKSYLIGARANTAPVLISTDGC